MDLGEWRRSRMGSNLRNVSVAVGEEGQVELSAFIGQEGDN